MANSSKGVFGFPATIYENKDDYASGVVMLLISGKEFADVTFAPTAEPDYSSDMYFQRLFYIGDTYYYLDYGTIYTVDMADGSCTEVYQISGGNNVEPVTPPIVY